VELPLLKIVSGEKPREIAAHVLQRRSRPRAGFVEDILDEALAKAALSAPDRRLTLELVCGAVRWQATLDWLITRKTRGRPQKPMLQNLLRLGLYQVFWLDRIPNHAAVNETVETAKRCGCGPQAGFLNALLRGYLREFAATQELLAALKTTQPYLGYSHPEWLLARWQERWGQEQTTRLLEWNNRPPEIYARVNTLKIDPAALLERWRKEKIEYNFVRCDWFDENLVFELKSHPPLHEVLSFTQGWFYVQDPSTLLAVRELNPQPGERILDFCAAPGGKTTYIAQRVRNQACLVAQDVSPERLKLIEENCARLNVTCVSPILASDLDPPPSSFDRILVDVPCSNTGVMRRRVDLRWRIRPEEITRLRTAQRRLLNRAAALLKPDGTLVYSTCSLEPEENHELLEQFLREHPEYRLLQERELLPFRDRVDGAFVARLGRVG
jgi:16S rRNA (cytosine967-C5)-methyltransferase